MSFPVDNRRVDFQTRTASAAYDVLPNDGPIIASYRSATGTGTVDLPDLALANLPVGWRVTVLDAGNNAGTNAQTVREADGSPEYVINTDGGSVTFEVTTTTATGTTQQWSLVSAGGGGTGVGFGPLTDTFFVDASYTGGASDGSVANPFTTLQDAVDAASVGGVLAIYVADEGASYTETVTIGATAVRVYLYGRCRMTGDLVLGTTTLWFEASNLLITGDVLVTATSASLVFSLSGNSQVTGDFDASGATTAGEISVVLNQSTISGAVIDNTGTEQISVQGDQFVITGAVECNSLGNISNSLFSSTVSVITADASGVTNTTFGGAVTFTADLDVALDAASRSKSLLAGGNFLVGVNAAGVGTLDPLFQFFSPLGSQVLTGPATIALLFRAAVNFYPVVTDTGAVTLTLPLANLFSRGAMITVCDSGDQVITPGPGIGDTIVGVQNFSGASGGAAIFVSNGATSWYQITTKV